MQTSQLEYKQTNLVLTKPVVLVTLSNLLTYVPLFAHNWSQSSFCRESSLKNMESHDTGHHWNSSKTIIHLSKNLAVTVILSSGYPEVLCCYYWTGFNFRKNNLLTVMRIMDRIDLNLVLIEKTKIAPWLCTTDKWIINQT